MIQHKTISSVLLRLGMLAVVALLNVTMAMAQQITSVHGTVADDMGPLMGATVCEIDGTGRIINSAVTDLNGNFTMKVKNDKNKIRFSYVGTKTQILPINKSTFNIMMSSATQIKEVTVKSKKRMQGNALPIPEREISYATQTISMKEFEGLGITSVDEALQGRIAGLDIVAGSGNLGSGSTMRLRGTSSISSLTNQNPLIVIDGNVWSDESGELSSFDFGSSSDEQFAQLLKINPEDISSITVLKDAAATAIYGSQGGSGVIEITTKRGVRGKPKLTYSLKLTGTYQPKGYDLLNGDDYTMLLKESYFNPQQNDNVTAGIDLLNYRSPYVYSEAEQYNNNTDWRDAVTQWGLRQNHYVTISGGGEKATFRISGGFDRETGSVIKQKLQRFSTRVNLDYNVSQRIRVQTNFALTYTKNDQNSDNLLSIAQKKMPNMGIYEQDRYTGEDTGAYYAMLQNEALGNRVWNVDKQEWEYQDFFKGDQKAYPNPVASAHLAKNQTRSYDMNPELVINYQLLGLDEDHWQLNWRGSVYMNISNKYVDRYYPSELVTTAWSSNNHNTSYSASSKAVSFNTKHTLTLIPYFANKDHSMMVMGRFELNSGTSTGQSTNGYGLASGTITSPEAGGMITNPGSSFGEWRSMYFTGSAHYAYKGRYVADATLRADGTSKFGPGRRWGYFPSISLKWIVSDEPWMEKLKPVLSMAAIRPSWGRVGHAPTRDYLYTSIYRQGATYIDMTSFVPDNIRLTDLKWETISSYNFGLDLGFLDDRLTFTLELYRSTTSDMLMGGYRIPSSAGFTHLATKNNGKMRNTGWEFHINTNRLVKAGKFTMDLNANFGNNRNEILEMDENILKGLNSTFNYTNAQVLQRVQLHNPFGAIYGFRYEGVYTHNYDTFAGLNSDEMLENLGIAEADRYAAFLNGTLPDEWYAAKGWEKRPYTAPVAINENGDVILDDKGRPVRMVFGHSNEPGTGLTDPYKFAGGDAKYEDVDHNGNIDKYDIVYLGSSLPKLTGGFGFTFNYAGWRLTTQFNYRVGNKILNMARMDLEAMTGNNNQSQAVNYRWRKEGQVTPIPRAMYGNASNYNTLVSDRFVEDGSYLRMSYAQLSYAIQKKHLKWIGLNRINIYASVNNPFVLTKYSGVDPDVNYGGYGAAVDWGQTPRARSYTLGLTVDF